MVTHLRPAVQGDALQIAAILDIAGHGVDHEYLMSLRDGTGSRKWNGYPGSPMATGMARKPG